MPRPKGSRNKKLLQEGREKYIIMAFRIDGKAWDRFKVKYSRPTVRVREMVMGDLSGKQ